MKPALLTLLALLITAPAAQAEWYFSKRGAEKISREYASDRYGYNSVYTVCRPQGEDRADPNYKYHRWVCGWAARDGCGGQVLIVGSRGKGAYYGKVTSGMTCE